MDDIVEFTARVANTGAETLAGFYVVLGLPDALDARTVLCTGEVPDAISCRIAVLGPGSIAEAKYYVHVGVRDPNGPVTALVFAADGEVLAIAQLPPLKIIGRPTPR